MAFWGGMGGGMGPGGMMGGPGMQRPNMMGQQGLRRSVDAWDDEELGAAYNHAVVTRMAAYVKPYKWRALFAVSGVVLTATLREHPARRHRQCRRRRRPRATRVK